MQILTDIKLKQKTIAPEEEAKREVLVQNTFVEEKTEKPETCKEFTETTLKMTAQLENVKFILLHPEYDTKLFMCEIDTSFFEYAAHIDHDNIRGVIGNTILYDSTNYPNTMSPLNYEEESINLQKIMEITSATTDESEFHFDIVSYYPHCPDRPQNLMSKMFLHLGTIKVDYYNELLLYRFNDYLIYQFIDSLSPRDYVKESLALYEKNKKSYEGLDFYSVLSFSSFSYIEVTIEQPLLYLKPRFNYEDYFVINLGKLKVWNERVWSTGRWVKHPNEKLLCEVYHIESNSLNVKYNGNVPIVDSVPGFMLFEFPCIETHDYNNHLPDVLDISLHLRVDAPIIMKIYMMPEHYTYLLKCLDLNVNYTDGQSDKFNFRRVNVNVIQGGIKYKLDTNCPLISFVALMEDNSVLAEFVVRNFELNWICKNDYTKVIKFGADHFYSLHEENTTKNKKNIIVAPLISGNEVRTDDSFYSLKERQFSDVYKKSIIGQKLLRATLTILEDYEKIWEVEIEKHKVFLKMYVYMLLSHFFIEGFPNYENSQDQPNNCKN